MALKAVITADVVHSTKMSTAHRKWFNEKINKLLTFLENNKLLQPNDYETSRGDSFQCLIHKPENALKIGFILKTGIKLLDPSKPQFIDNGRKVASKLLEKKNFDIRISIGIGTIAVNSKKLSTSDGEAFQLSGRRIDEMKNERQTFCVTTNDNFKSELYTQSFLIDNILAHATPLQCEVIYWKLYGLNEVAIAQKLDIKQSAVNQRSTSGGWHSIEVLLKRFQEIYGAK